MLLFYECLQRKMRLKADIEVSNRSLAVHNMNTGKRKDAHAFLTIGRKPKGLKQTTLKENKKVTLLVPRIIVRRRGYLLN